MGRYIAANICCIYVVIQKQAKGLIWHFTARPEKNGYIISEGTVVLKYVGLQEMTCCIILDINYEIFQIEVWKFKENIRLTDPCIRIIINIPHRGIKKG